VAPVFPGSRSPVLRTVQLAIDADRLPNQVQLVHDVNVKYPLPGDVILDNEVDAVPFVITTRYQNVARERCYPMCESKMM
jgi:hypothetical protein